MISRRHFLKSTAMAGTGALLLRGRAWPFAQSPTNLRKFVTTLPGLGPSGANDIGQYIPLATKTHEKFAGHTNRHLQPRGCAIQRADASRPSGQNQLLRLLRSDTRRSEISCWSHRGHAGHTGPA